MKSGYRVIKEPGQRGLRGYYFSCEQYRSLVKIKDFAEVKERIAEWGYPGVRMADNVSDVVEILSKSMDMTNYEKGCLAATILEPLFWLILLFFSGC